MSRVVSPGNRSVKPFGVTISILVPAGNSDLDLTVESMEGVSPPTTSIGKKFVGYGDAFAEREHCDNGSLC